MILAKILGGYFQDSVTLMILSRDLSATAGVDRVSVMMGTPANKDVFRETGLWHELLAAATPNDLCIVVDAAAADPAIVETIAQQLQDRLATLAKGQRSAGYPTARSWRRARQLLPDANLALVSVAGHYAFEPARQALEDGCHVMMFSDNVPVEQEVKLKGLAGEKGLLFMGPDCGTAIVRGAPLAFANRVPAGPIAVVGASGTGIQELTSQIARHGGGITHALGLGGRDLSAGVGGASAASALALVAADPASRVIAFVSKPPAEAVKARILEQMHGLDKPVVALFLGERPVQRVEGNVYRATTLDEAATLAVELAMADSVARSQPGVAGKGICGLFTGGTLAAEAACLIAETLGVSPDEAHAEGVMLSTGNHRVVDLGDDVYTRGRPHPMIDPSLRNRMIGELAGEDSVGVLVLDVVLGFGSHPDPAGEVAKAVTVLREARQGRPVVVVATLTGTEEDPQDRSSQAAKLDEAGVIIADSVRAAVMLATRLVAAAGEAPGETPELLARTPAVVNIGLRGFADDLHACGVKVVHQQWEPGAGGNERLQKLVARLN